MNEGKTNVFEKLMNVQFKLKAPKSQHNNFGDYSYRSCEDIMEALKPLLSEVKAVVIIADDVVLMGNRYYVKATAVFIDAETGEKVENTAYAREGESKKGFDGSQITGASSSYARKYALNGLFCIDDTKDSDNPIPPPEQPKGQVQPNKQPEKPQNRQNNNRFVSAKKEEELYNVALKVGYDKEKVNKMINKRYQKTITELTQQEYTYLYSGFAMLLDDKQQGD